MREDDWNELITKCDIVMSKIKLAELKCKDKDIFIKLQAIEKEIQNLHDDLCDMMELDISQEESDT